jgi:hypothetical protein
MALAKVLHARQPRLKRWIACFVSVSLCDLLCHEWCRCVRGGGLFPVESERGILRWVAPLPDSVPIAGLYKWTLANEQGALNLKLVDLNGEAVFPSKSLVNDLVEFRVQLQGRTSGAWTERWDESELPQRVRLHIKTVAYGDWPPITVRIGGGL